MADRTRITQRARSREQRQQQRIPTPVEVLEKYGRTRQVRFKNTLRRMRICMKQIREGGYIRLTHDSRQLEKGGVPLCAELRMEERKWELECNVKDACLCHSEALFFIHWGA